MPTNDLHPVLLIIAGPAGSGKTTLCQRLVAEHKNVARVITATTRAPRAGEVQDRDYHFFSESQFDEHTSRGEFLEWARVHGRNRYGTLRRSVLEPLEAGTSLVMNIDVQGVRSIQKAAQSDPVLKAALVTVFVAPKSLDELRLRLSGRGTDDPQEIERRMQTAIEEMRELANFDHVITSNSRDEDYAALLALWRTSQRRAAAHSQKPTQPR